MLSKFTKIIVPATAIAIVALTMTASSSEAFARGNSRGNSGMHGMSRGYRGFGNYRNRGYFGYRNYGWGSYGSYCEPSVSYCAEYAPVYPVCESTVCEAPVYQYPVCSSYCDGYGYGWGRNYRNHFWGHRGFGGRGMGGHRGGRR
jgi:hypothetical protein